MNEPSIIMLDSMPAMVSMGNGKWKTVEPWKFVIDGMTTCVPKDFVCDLYSSPWMVRPFLPQDEPDNRPALIHDWLFATVGLRLTGLSPIRISLDRANLALLVAMRRCGFSWWRRNAIYAGVRIGGWRPWNSLKAEGCSLLHPKMN